nr:uncharacterized protein LOC109153653 isoform X2 [Ipomoea trifida]
MAGNHLLLLLLLLIYTRAAGAGMIGGCRTAAECATAGGGGVIGEEFAMLMDSETNKLRDFLRGQQTTLSTTRCRKGHIVTQKNIKIAWENHRT